VRQIIRVEVPRYRSKYITPKPSKRLSSIDLMCPANTGLN